MVKQLTDSQLTILNEVLGPKRTVMTDDECRLLCEQFNVSKEALIRRSHLSGRNLRRGYWFEQLTSSSITKRYVVFVCTECQELYEIQLCKFLLRRQHVAACKKCYARVFVPTAEWKEKNSRAQLVAQNRPETLKLHRQNSTQMWIDNREKMLHSLRESVAQRWSDPIRSARMRESMRMLWQDPSYREKVWSSSQSKTGSYDGIKYYSLHELAFCMWMKSLARSVVRFDDEPIMWEDVDGNPRNYYPDFVVDRSVVVEVKGKYWYDKHREDVDSKVTAAKTYCRLTGKEFRLVFGSDIPREWMIAAHKVHYENHAEEKCTSKV